MAWKKSNTTPHSNECTMAFGRLSAPGCCPRCEELRAGAKPVAGWNDSKKKMEAQQLEAIARHFAPGGEGWRKAKNGEVDTAFDW